MQHFELLSDGISFLSIMVLKSNLRYSCLFNFPRYFSSTVCLLPSFAPFREKMFLRERWVQHYELDNYRPHSNYLLKFSLMGNSLLNAEITLEIMMRWLAFKSEHWQRKLITVLLDAINTSSFSACNYNGNVFVQAYPSIYGSKHFFFSNLN